MDHRSGSPSYSSLFAILIIIAIMIAGARIGLNTLVALRHSDHTIHIEGQRPLPEDTPPAEAATYIEHVLNKTESDQRTITELQTRLQR